jgi:hypothetical protein
MPVMFLPWTVQALNELGFDRIDGGHEHDRNGGRRVLRRDRGVRGARHDHRHLALDQIGGQGRQTPTFRPAIFDRYVLAFDVS